MKLFTFLLVLFMACVTLSGLILVLPEKETLTLSGLVQAREMKDVSLSGGRVEEVLVQEGDVVQKGQVLIRLDNAELISQIVQAEAALTQAKARSQLLSEGADAPDIRQASAGVQQAEENLQLVKSSGEAEILQAQAKLQQAENTMKKTQASYENAPKMLAEGIISQQRYDTLVSQYEEAQSALKAARETLKQVRQGSRQEQINIARSKLEGARANYEKVSRGARKEERDIAMASIEQAESQLKALKAQLSETEVKAKIPGQIAVMNLLPGDAVLRGQPIISIIDYDHLWTDIYVPENKLYMVKVGQVVEVTASAYDKKVLFRGDVAAINPKSEFVPSTESTLSIEESAFRVKVRLDHKAVSHDAELRPGMKVNLTFAQNR